MMTKANSLIALFLLSLAATAFGLSPNNIGVQPRIPTTADVPRAPTILFSSNNHPNDNEETSLLSLKTTKDEVSRRVALVMAAATFAAGGYLPAAEAIPLSGKVEALEFENKDYVNVKGAPEKHLPLMTISDTSVEVVVPHVMDAEKPHWIEFVWLKDEDTKKIIAAKRFEAGDPSPPTLTHSVNKGTKVRALLFCNLHGLWQGEAFTV